jgi:prophage regulatory protein
VSKQQAEKIYRKAELYEVTGLARTAIEKMMAEGVFPRPITLAPGGRAVGWLSSEIAAWQEQRKAARDGGEPVLTDKQAEAMAAIERGIKRLESELKE